MYKMLALAGLCVSCVVPGFCDLPQSKKFNLQAHEKRINAFHDKMTNDGKVNELSEEFLTVHQGMKKNSYMYDFETARKVMREVYANRIPAAPKDL